MPEIHYNGPQQQYSHLNGPKESEFSRAAENGWLGRHEDDNGPVLRIAVDGSLVFANSTGRELLTALGWIGRGAVPNVLLQAAEQAMSRRQPFQMELGEGDLACSFWISPFPATKHVNFYGSRIHGAPPTAHALLEAVPNLICCLDASGKALYVNHRWRDFTGLTLKRFNHRGWETLHHPDELGRLQDLWAQGRKTGSAFEAEYRYRRYDGEYRWLLGRFVPMRTTADGEVTQWIGSCTDIHAQKMAEAAAQTAKEQLQRQKEKLEHVVAARTEQLRNSLGETQEFAHSVAHDLRAPLRAIEGLAKVVLEECEPVLGPNADYLGRICRATQRMERFVDSLLELGRLTHHRLDLQPVDLAEVIRDLVAERPDLQPPRAYVDLPSTPIVVRGDIASLVQCVTNLLGNAVKFVAEGTVPRIEVRSQSIGRNLIVSFKDNGIGISRKHLKSVFAPFRRVAGGEFEGNGLGLAIVQKAVNRMRGKIGVQSEPGKGSAFWIELPAATAG